MFVLNLFTWILLWWLAQERSDVYMEPENNNEEHGTLFARSLGG